MTVEPADCQENLFQAQHLPSSPRFF